MPPPARAAYISWLNQRRRCHVPNHKQYKYYGGKGIRVQYEAREFIGWWLQRLKSFSGKIPTVGRLDHGADYTFNNIMLQDKAENSREMNRRVPNRPSTYRPVRMYCYACNTTLRKFKSQRAASIETGIEESIISGIANGRHRRTHEGYAFERINRGKHGKANNSAVCDSKKRKKEY